MCSFELEDRIVRVHVVHLTAPDVVTAQFQAILTPDERDLAARFRFRHLQDSFVLARGALRILLGRYLRADPAGIPLHYGSKGKPGLAGPARLRFNLSHSGGLGLFAFTLDCEVGIDVEAIRPVPDMEAIAGRLFSAEEAAELRSLPPCRRDPAFFLCWTRMEAFGKALGDGLSARRPDAGRSTVQNLDVPPQYASALAYLDETRSVEVLPAVEVSQLLELR